MKSFLRRREDLKKYGKLVIWIWIILWYTSFEAKFYADYEFEVNNLCLTTHTGENLRFKNLRRRFEKNFTRGRVKPSKNKIQES